MVRAALDEPWAARPTYPEIPPHVEYKITDLGRSLAPVFASLVNWPEEHLDNGLDARTAYDASDRPMP